MLKVAGNLMLAMPYAELFLKLLKEKYFYKIIYI